MSFRKISALVLALSTAGLAQAAPVVITNAGLSYSQSFDSLQAATWANDSTLAGWSVFQGATAGTATATLTLSDGATTSGGLLSLGTTGAADRALGTLATNSIAAAGSNALYTALALTNSTGRALDSFTLNYDGEQWRNGGNTTAQSLIVQYGFGSSFAAVTSWTAAGNGFNFSSPVFTATAGKLDGNAAANRVAGLGGSVTTSWAAGATLWVRWVDANDAGNDHGLAIDNVSFSVPAATVTPEVPEPSSHAIALAGLAVAGLVARRCKAA